MHQARKQALSGSAWTVFGYGTSQVIRLGSNILLAHLLFPAAFGVMALVTVVMQGLQMFSDVGIGPSIIQSKRGEDQTFLNTAWTIQAIRGVVLWLICCALAWPAAVFYGKSDPMAHELLWVLPVAGLSAIINGFNSTSVFTLNRSLSMAKVTLLELIPQAFSVVGMVVWGFLAPSVWALVSGWIIQSTAKCVMSHVLNPAFRNRFLWNPACVHELMHFGRWIFLSTMISFMAGSFDRLALAKLISLTELGIYSIALTFVRIAIEVSNRLSNTVLFPLLSRFQEEPVRLVELCLKARSLVLLVGGAMVSTTAILSPLFFELLYSASYAGAGEVARWLSIFVWASILLSSMERVPLALGHPKALVVSNLIATAGYALAIPGYHYFGLPGFIVSLAFAVLLAHLYLVHWMPSGRMRMLRQTMAYSAVHGSYAIGIVLLEKCLPGDLPHAARIAFAVVFGLLPCGVAGIVTLKRLRKPA